MTKTITKLLVALFGLTCISSCDFDMYGTYSFQHQGQYVVKEGNEETTGKAISEYFNSIVDFEEIQTFTGTHYEAVEYGNNLFVETLEKFDSDYINSLLAEDEEVVYMLTMSGMDNYITIGWARWPNNTDEDGEGDGSSDGSGDGTSQQ